MAALARYGLDNWQPSQAFHDIVKLAADLFDVPTSLVSVIGGARQIIKSGGGPVRRDTSRETSFCMHGLDCDDLMIVEDATLDPRFCSNPYVVAAPHIRFYAGAPLRTACGHTLGMLCVIGHIPRQKVSERERTVLRQLARFSMDHLELRRLGHLERAAMRMAAATPDAIVCLDEHRVITFWNASAEAVFGYSRAEALGRPLDLVVPAHERGRYHAALQRFLGKGKSKSKSKGPASRAVFELAGLRRDGSLVPVELTLASWRLGRSRHIGATIRDISERRRTHERLAHLTLFDSLTTLPNRAHFLHAVDESLKATSPFSVLNVGLDRFRDINGSLGLPAGDMVLAQAGDRVRSVAGEDAFVARLGGDEFGIVLQGCGDPVRAGEVASSVTAALGEPFEVHRESCRLSASIGMLVAPGLSRPDSANAVLKSCLLALHQAKKQGGGRTVLFQPQLGREAEERRRLVEELRAAFCRGEFELHYQPQVRLQDRAVVGAEALLRWRHPTRGLLLPGAFLPVLETLDLSAEVGRWVIEAACRMAATLGRTPFRMGVNLFARQVRDPDLAAGVLRALSDASLPPERLELEITETTVLGLDEDALAPLRDLYGRGVGIAFDDYGTGFACLSSLKRYPLTRLKIDREFVRDLTSDCADAAIVRAVIGMGASFDLEVIAEGIETERQAEILAGFGCREAQGYLFGKPMPEGQFRDLIDVPACRAAA